MSSITSTVGATPPGNNFDDVKQSVMPAFELTTLPYSSTNGRRVHESVIVMEVPSDSSDLPPDAPLAILLPGTGVEIGYYERLRAPLRKMGVRMASVEARGGGKSSLRAGRDQDWSYGDIIDEDYPAFIKVCRENAPKASVVFALAHSMGGQLAILAAAHGRLDVDGIVTVATASLYKQVLGTNAAQRAVLASTLAMMRGISRLRGYWPGETFGFFGRLPRTYVRRDFYRQFLNNSWYTEIKGEPVHFEEAMRNLSIPVSMVHFSHGDWIATAVTVVDMAKRIGPNGAAVHALTDERIKSTHAGWVKHSDKVMEVVGQFVAELQPKSNL
jgi:predicted alpha/beta hydrolase